MAVLPGQAPGRVLLAVLADDKRQRLCLLCTGFPLVNRYPALTPDLPQAQAFEREILEEHGLVPDGHPWLKPLRRHADLEGLGDARVVPDGYPFFRVEGPGIHEVAVGPVHAGIIEPGHFRFQCHGETVLHLEIQLGYQHRDAQALLLRSSPARRLVIAETIAGDTSVGHALAYCMALEGLTGTTPPPQAEAMRGIALELERTANHVGDLGALCNDVGYLPGASWFGRLRGEFLNLSLEICGSRFGRGLVIPGGVRFWRVCRLQTPTCATLPTWSSKPRPWYRVSRAPAWSPPPWPRHSAWWELSPAPAVATATYGATIQQGSTIARASSPPPRPRAA
jgi:hypothetical protein